MRCPQFCFTLASMHGKLQGLLTPVFDRASAAGWSDWFPCARKASAARGLTNPAAAKTAEVSLQEEQEAGKLPQQSGSGSGHIKALFQDGDAAAAAPAQAEAAPPAVDWLSSQDRFMSLANGIMQAGVDPTFHAR